jgi:hypothetical protein
MINDHTVFWYINRWPDGCQVIRGKIDFPINVKYALRAFNHKIARNPNLMFIPHEFSYHGCPNLHKLKAQWSHIYKY